MIEITPTDATARGTIADLAKPRTRRIVRGKTTIAAAIPTSVPRVATIPPALTMTSTDAAATARTSLARTPGEKVAMPTASPKVMLRKWPKMSGLPKTLNGRCT